MDRNEALGLLRQQLDRHRTRSHRELQSLIVEPDVVELVGSSGTRFCIEVLAVWDSQVGGDLRVIGSIDDGGWRAFKPLTDDFIMPGWNPGLGTHERPCCTFDQTSVHR